jgi:phage-related holin
MHQKVSDLTFYKVNYINNIILANYIKNLNFRIKNFILIIKKLL